MMPSRSRFASTISASALLRNPSIRVVWNHRYRATTMITIAISTGQVNAAGRAVVIAHAETRCAGLNAPWSSRLQPP